MKSYFTKPKLIVIGGPTASGKTDMAIDICKRCNGEIVNADSRQIYKELNIGTNKGLIVPIDGEVVDLYGYKLQAFDIEKTGVVGWLFDIVNPDEEFNLAIYKKLADSVIRDITSRKKIPVLVGGTGLYIDALVKNFNLEGERTDDSVRQILNQLSLNELQEKLKSLSLKVFDSLNNSDANNSRRLIRYIEKTLNGNENTEQKSECKYEVEYCIPKYEKSELSEKINKRVVKMFDEGLVEETKQAIRKGWGETKAMQSMTYKEVQKNLKGEIDYDKCVELIQLEHRKYAKRQMTWFRKSYAAKGIFPLTTIRTKV